MATLSINNLWAFLQSLSLTASNEQWLAERLYESAATKKNMESVTKMKALDGVFGAWNKSDDSDLLEKAVSESRNSDYVRQMVSFDE